MLLLSEQQLVDLACGATAGLLARIPCHPFDTCKTVAAATEGRLSCSTLPCAARTIYAREGIQGFYRGVGVASIGAAPGNAIYLTTYELLKARGPLIGASSESTALHLAAGLCAEAAACVVWLPVDVVKERLQTQGPEVRLRYTNSVDGFIRIARYEGLRSLYKGYTMTLLSFGPYSAFYFASFEAFKRALFGLGASDNPMPYQSAVAGFLGTVTACVSTQPLEVVKTRYQIQRAKLDATGTEFSLYTYRYTGLRHGISLIIAGEGIPGLWRGLGPRIIYQAPNAAITFALFAYLKGLVSSSSASSLNRG